MPCIGLENGKIDNNIYVIKDRDYSNHKIEQLIEGFFSKKGADPDLNLLIYKSLMAAKEKVELFKDTKDLSFLDFYAYMQDDSSDKAVFVYNSSEPLTELFFRKASIFNYVAKTHREDLHNHNLLLASYDIARVRLDQRFESDPSFSIDTFYVIPADYSSGSFLKFVDYDESVWTSSIITEFIEAHRRFKYQPANEAERAAFSALLQPLSEQDFASPEQDADDL